MVVVDWHVSVPPPFFLTAANETTTVADILIFSSGTDKVPPIGFEKQPSIFFLHGSTNIFATSSTCDIHLRLPTKHQDYKSFREAMVMSLKDNDGFGGV